MGTGAMIVNTMVMHVVALGAMVLTMLCLPAYEAQAQGRGKRELLGSFRDWDALVMTSNAGEKTCYMISTAKRWTASRKNVSRGDIYVIVQHRPAFDVKDEINVNVGYPLKSGSEVTVSVDGKPAYRLFTEGRAAWAYDPRDDRAMVAAFKRGSRMVAKATSARGTVTTDTYSLSGFTAAYNAITKACR